MHDVHTHVRTSEHPNEHNFDLDDRISFESELDTETRALLYLLYPDDFPASYEPMLDDSQLAQLIHQMPGNNKSFLDLLQAASLSPIKSITSSFDGGDFNFEFLNNADFGLNGDSTAATILDAVNLDISQPNPITNQQPLVTTKSTGAP